MKLYATITSDRASKGQGGNKTISINLQVEKSDKTRPIIAELNMHRDDYGDYLITFVPLDCEETTNRPTKTRRWIVFKKAKKETGGKCSYCTKYPCSEHDGSKYE